MNSQPIYGETSHELGPYKFRTEGYSTEVINPTYVVSQRKILYDFEWAVTSYSPTSVILHDMVALTTHIFTDSLVYTLQLPELCYSANLWYLGDYKFIFTDSDTVIWSKKTTRTRGTQCATYEYVICNLSAVIIDKYCGT